MRGAAWRWANVPIPEQNLAAVGIAAIAHAVLPVRLPIGRRTARLIGLPVAAAGIGLAAWAVRSASVAGVAVDRPERLVTTGAFAVARHPMYQGWAMAVGGIGLAARSAWLLAASAVAARLTDRAALAEEATLHGAFRDDYATYASATPRYLDPAGFADAVGRIGSMIGGGFRGVSTWRKS